MSYLVATNAKVLKTKDKDKCLTSRNKLGQGNSRAAAALRATQGAYTSPAMKSQKSHFVDVLRDRDRARSHPWESLLLGTRCWPSLLAAAGARW